MSFCDKAFQLHFLVYWFSLLNSEWHYLTSWKHGRWKQSFAMLTQLAIGMGLRHHIIKPWEVLNEYNSVYKYNSVHTSNILWVQQTAVALLHAFPIWNGETAHDFLEWKQMETPNWMQIPNDDYNLKPSPKIVNVWKIDATRFYWMETLASRCKQVSNTRQRTQCSFFKMI